MHSDPGPCPAGTHSLAGFVTSAVWTGVERMLRRHLSERPGEVVVVECGRVTGFSLEAFLAMGHLIKSAPGRIRLRKWPCELTRAVTPHLQLARALGNVITVLATCRAQVRSASVLEEVTRAEEQVAMVIAKFGQARVAIGVAPSESADSVRPRLVVHDPSIN